MYTIPIGLELLDLLGAAFRKAKILRNAGIVDLSGLSIILTQSKTTREFVEKLDNF